MKKILLFGSDGQVGWELQRTLAPLGKVIATDRKACDLAKQDAIVDLIKNVEPTLIVNAAAYTAVDRAQEEEGLAYAINSTAPETLALEAKKRSIPFIHYSTDYVFDGNSPVAYQEEDETAPINVYGRTKQEGECAIASIGGTYLILRTSWVYANRGQNFLKTMLKLAKDHKELRIVSDQLGVPNWARLIAEATAQVCTQVTQDTAGIYHLSSQGKTSWYGFAQKIFELAHIPTSPILIPITTEEYPTPAKRPFQSTLNSTKIKATFGIELPSWEKALSLFMDGIAYDR